MLNKLCCAKSSRIWINLFILRKCGVSIYIFRDKSNVSRQYKNTYFWIRKDQCLRNLQILYWPTSEIKALAPTQLSDFSPEKFSNFLEVFLKSFKNKSSLVQRRKMPTMIRQTIYKTLVCVIGVNILPNNCENKGCDGI